MMEDLLGKKLKNSCKQNSKQKKIECCVFFLLALHSQRKEKRTALTITSCRVVHALMVLKMQGKRLIYLQPQSSGVCAAY